MKSLIITFGILGGMAVLFMSFASPVCAKTAEEIMRQSSDPAVVGYAIAEEFDKRDLGYGDVKATMEMTLRNAHGDENKRAMRINILDEVSRDKGDKSIIVFDSPRDVAGTALLSHANLLESDDQWLFLPALKRVKRISSKNKSGPFLGSEFAYEDITANEINKYSWNYLATAPCPNDASQQCFQLETTPKYEYSGYTKRIAWIDTLHFRPMQMDYYDKKSAHAKTQTYDNYRLYLNKFWRAHDWGMKNLLNGKSTEIHFTQYDFRNGLGEGDFTVNKLKRVK